MHSKVDLISLTNKMVNFVKLNEWLYCMKNTLLLRLYLIALCDADVQILYKY